MFSNFSYGLTLRGKPRAFGVCYCLFFALSQRIGEEKTLKGLMPLRIPQDLLLFAPAVCGALCFFL